MILWGANKNWTFMFPVRFLAAKACISYQNESDKENSLDGQNNNNNIKLHVKAQNQFGLGRKKFHNGNVAYHLVDVNSHLLDEIAKIYVSSSWTEIINKSTLCTVSTIIKSVIEKNMEMNAVLYMAQTCDGIWLISSLHWNNLIESIASGKCSLKIESRCTLCYLLHIRSNWNY